MRQIRFAASAFVSFIAAIVSSFIDPGTFFHRTLSVTLCSVLGFTSNLCYANLAMNSGERAVAAFPPVEQTQKNSFPRRDFSPYLQSTRPEFDQPDLPARPATQSQSGNYPFTGIWRYAMHAAPSDIEPFYSNFMQVRHNGNEYVASFCEGNCDLQYFQPNQATHVLKEQALTADYEDLSFEIVESRDGQAIWGKVLDRTQGKSIYFTLTQQIPVVSVYPSQKQPIESIAIPGLSKRNLFAFLPYASFVATAERKDLKPSGNIRPNPNYFGYRKLNFNIESPSNDINSYINKGIDSYSSEVEPMTGIEDLRRVDPPQYPNSSNRVNPSQGVDNYDGQHQGNNRDNNRGRQNQQGGSQNEESNETLNRVTNIVQNAEQSAQQGALVKEWIEKHLGKWFTATFVPFFFGSIFNNMAAKSNTNLSTNDSNLVNNRNQRQPSPEQPDRNPNNRKPQPVAPPPPLQPEECLCKWSMNLNIPITRNGVPTVETYDYVTGCNRSAQEVREILRRQGIGTSLPDDTQVNGQTVGDVRRVTSPGDIPGNGCSDKLSPSPAPQPSPNPINSKPEQDCDCYNNPPPYTPVTPATRNGGTQYYKHCYFGLLPVPDETEYQGERSLKPDGCNR